jgi:hypothetical protein
MPAAESPLASIYRLGQRIASKIGVALATINRAPAARIVVMPSQMTKNRLPRRGDGQRHPPPR